MAAAIDHRTPSHQVRSSGVPQDPGGAESDANYRELRAFVNANFSIGHEVDSILESIATWSAQHGNMYRALNEYKEMDMAFWEREVGLSKFNAVVLLAKLKESATHMLAVQR